MIKEQDLAELCEKYNINLKKINKNSSSISKYGNYSKIDKVLNYLINVMKVPRSSIEKCPSILYVGIDEIEDNIKFLKDNNISFKDIKACLHVLSTEHEQLKDTYNYIIENYGIDIINKNISILSVSKNIIKSVENLNIASASISDVLSIAVSIDFGYTNIDEIKKILRSKEYQEHKELFTSQTLAHGNYFNIRELLNSREYQEHPELFNSETLYRTTLNTIKEVINSDEYKEHKELFTSTSITHGKLDEMLKLLRSKEYKEHKELFTSETLAYGRIDEIKKILRSKEYKEHKELFTAYTFAHGKLRRIRKILKSKSYEEHKELFTSEVLAFGDISRISRLLRSKEYKEHKELFSGTTLAHGNIDEIKKILRSEEYKEHKELFTSEVLVHAKMNDIKELFSLPYWKDDRFSNLLTSSIVARSKSMVKKIPKLIELAENHNIDGYLNVSYLTLSPSQNYAVIRYLEDNDIPLIINEKLNPIIGKTSKALYNNYGIDLKEIMETYPLDEKVKKKVRCNGIR